MQQIDKPMQVGGWVYSGCLVFLYHFRVNAVLVFQSPDGPFLSGRKMNHVA